MFAISSKNGSILDYRLHQVKAVTIVGHELAVYRGMDDSVVALDAY